MNIRLIFGALLGAALWLAGASVSVHAGYIDYTPFEFNIYLQQGAGELPGQRNPNGPISPTTPYGAFLRTISPGSPLANITEYSDHIHFVADDSAIGATGDGDIEADIYFVEGLPSKVVVLDDSPGTHSESALWRYIYDFKLDGKIIVSRWQTHYGETIAIPEPATLSLLALGGLALLGRRRVAPRTDRP